MRYALLFLPLLIILTACSPAGQEDCPEITDQTSVHMSDCPIKNCPFNITFDSDTYAKYDYFVIKPILPNIDAEDCDDALKERRNTTASLCKIQHAEIIREAGRQDGRDTWQWRIDCACSYQYG